MCRQLSGPWRSHTGVVSLETIMTIMMVVSALLFMFAYTQRAFQGNAFGTARAFGLQFDPRNRYTETQTIASMSDEVHQVSVGGMAAANLIPPVRPERSLADTRYYKRRDRLFTTLPTGPVPREPAFMQAESNANWEARRSVTYDDAK